MCGAVSPRLRNTILKDTLWALPWYSMLSKTSLSLLFSTSPVTLLHISHAPNHSFLTIPPIIQTPQSRSHHLCEVLLDSPVQMAPFFLLCLYILTSPELRHGYIWGINKITTLPHPLCRGLSGRKEKGKRRVAGFQGLCPLLSAEATCFGH